MNEWWICCTASCCWDVEVLLDQASRRAKWNGMVCFACWFSWLGLRRRLTQFFSCSPTKPHPNTTHASSCSLTSSPSIRLINPRRHNLFKAFHWWSAAVQRSFIISAQASWGTGTTADLLHSKGVWESRDDWKRVWKGASNPWTHIIETSPLTASRPRALKAADCFSVTLMSSSLSLIRQFWVPPAARWGLSYWNNSKSFSCSAAFTWLPGRQWWPASQTGFSVDIVSTWSSLVCLKMTQQLLGKRPAAARNVKHIVSCATADVCSCGNRKELGWSFNELSVGWIPRWKWKCHNFFLWDEIFFQFWHPLLYKLKLLWSTAHHFSFQQDESALRVERQPNARLMWR